MGRTLQPDDRISHYRVVGPLAAGGMGEVYVAADESLDRNVALKVLPPRLVVSDERVRRFIREAKSASSLNHPNIVTIYEIGHDAVRTGGSPPSPAVLPVHFISMELVDGRTLSRKIHEDNEDLRTLVGYVAQAAEGIAKAHAAGIVHRDLKPSNIMVSNDGFVKVLDFGLAKLTEREASGDGTMTSAPTEDPGTGEGVVLGTVGYMSPEHVQGKAADHRSDIFSVGCILYEAATRRRPFVADTDVEVMHQILRDRPAPIEELNPGVPAELRRIIRRCLAKSPDQRFQSMKDLAIDLREVVEDWESLPAAGSSTALPKSEALAAPRAWKGWRKAGFAAALAVGLVGLALGLYSLVGKLGSAPPATPAGGSMKISSLMSRDDLGEAILSGDGRYLAYVVAVGERSSLNVRQVRTGSDVQILAPQEFQVHGISFSPDGDYLYFLNRDPKLPNYSAVFEVASLGGTPRKVAFDVDTAVTFSPSGKQICFRRGLATEQADSLVVLELETGNERTLVRLKDPERFRSPGGAGAPVWSPDGRRIAAPVFDTSAGARTFLATFDVETGRRDDLKSAAWLFVDSVRWLPDGRSIALSGFDLGSQRSQIYRVSFPAGDVTRITSDLDGYGGISVASDGGLIAAVRRTGVGNIWIAPLESAKEAHPVTFATGSGASVEFITPLGDGGIAFTAAERDRTFVWRIEPDGSGRKQLTSQGVYVFFPAFAEGAGLVFTQVEENAVLHVWRTGADGDGLTQITRGAGEQLEELSPDGRTLLFWKVSDQTSLWKAPVSGGEPVSFLPNVEFGSPRFSADGTRLLYSSVEESGGRIYPRQVVIPVGGGVPLASFRLPPGAEDTSLTPGGDAVTYVDRGTGFNLMRRPIAKDETEQLTRFADGRIHGHEWSPDGRKVLLLRRAGQRDSLWILEPRSGKPPRMLTEFMTGRIDKYAWARDSRSVVFTYGTLSQDVVLISNFR